MTQYEIDAIAHDKEVADHNEQFLKSLGSEAERDFEELLDDCYINGKINFVGAPQGTDNDEDCGVYKNIHVNQWSNNIAGDSFGGFIYAKIKNQWIEVPFYC